MMLYWFLFNISLKSFGLVVKMSVTLKLDPLTMTYCLNEAEMVGQGLKNAKLAESFIEITSSCKRHMFI